MFQIIIQCERPKYSEIWTGIIIKKDKNTQKKAEKIIYLQEQQNHLNKRIFKHLHLIAANSKTFLSFVV